MASDNYHPYAITDDAYRALIMLLADICKRHNKTKLLWFGNEEETFAYTPKNDEIVLTVHRWFAPKACPGDYLYNKHAEIADKVTNMLNGAEEDEEEMTQERFNAMMENYLASLTKKPATFEQDALIWA